ncbi:MAG: ribose 1,5-bisphosphate isomerase [Nitrososphaerota archaeon]|nr:ribose 1,5-bisphosphate isomerase [Candidatus Bathyarchaeota archaeon]MDW8194521.1 ribose 1,5-bisphosphate isomerase [Nitrososphaerota archaeon]
MINAVRETAEKIKRLEIRGARNIAIAAMEAIDEYARHTKAGSREEFLKELYLVKEMLFATRETEPLMRNALRFVISRVEENGEKNMEELVKVVHAASKQFLSILEESRERIAEFGSRRIRDGSVILTHCHSSTVTYMLRRAKEKGKSFEVFCTETRPFLQGRITARELVEAGIRTTLIVDSAARFFMNKIDMVVVGADAITSEGNVVNKIGTSMMALAAKEARTPFYVVSELLKFDPATMYGDYEKIEERSPSEVWSKPPGNLLIRNPVFDVTRRDFIHGIICEEGIVSPHLVTEIVRRRHPWIFG